MTHGAEGAQPRLLLLPARPLTLAGPDSPSSRDQDWSLSGTGPSHVLCWQTGCAQGPQRGQDLCPEHVPTWDPVWLEALLLLT